MTQADLVFDAPIRMPDPGTQHFRILMALKAGRRLTVGVALEELRIYALSQRVGELKRMGWPITARTVETAGGARIAEYSMEPQ